MTGVVRYSVEMMTTATAVATAASRRLAGSSDVCDVPARTFIGRELLLMSKMRTQTMKRSIRIFWPFGSTAWQLLFSGRPVEG
jgi:hypothetical protein